MKPVTLEHGSDEEQRRPPRHPLRAKHAVQHDEARHDAD
jgi:hypothetical protein